MRFIFTALLSLLFPVFLGCSDNAIPSHLKKNSLASPPLSPPISSAFFERHNYRKTPVQMSTSTLTQLLFNTHFTNHYGKQVPKAPILADYRRNGNLIRANTYLMAELGSVFSPVLPKALQAELAKERIDKKNLEIAFIIQLGGILGEESDFHGVATQTRLMAHGWADPDAPEHYNGTRVNRDFLMGIFESETDISSPDFQAGTLTEVPIYVHDERFSPPTSKNIVKLHHGTKSQSFWSLVIDHQNPSGTKRAQATLHWFIRNYGDDLLELLELNRILILSPGYIDRVTKRFIPSVFSIHNFGDFLDKLNESALFKQTKMLEQLNALFK